ncbi:LytTR family transcriptional regulator DNA-binding domain-containing protein [Clostridium saccharobutylicum]|uniref:LytTR family transcriptional regulator DNA-binding domain-containing protein n=1 Tax=Clostridium saccharobutylicum TaxID=169679 RepID=UPI00098BD166
MYTNFLKDYKSEVITYPNTNLNNSILIFWDDEICDNNEIKCLSKISNLAGISSKLFSKKIVALNDNKRLLININSILYFYYEGTAINIITDNNSIYRVNHSLSFWEGRLLEENFIRCQKGYLVNIEKVVAIVPYFNSTLALKFKGHDKTVPVGRKFAKHFKDIIGW